MLPVVVAVAVYRIAETERRREMFIRLTAAAVASALFLALLYFWHLGTLAGATNGSAKQHLNASYAKTLAATSLFPRISYLARSITENPLHWVLLLLGASGVMSSYKLGRARALLILAFLLPLFSVAIYRNAFPYYYAFMLAPGAVLWAAAAGRAELRKYVWLAAVVLLGFTFVHHQRALSTAANDQERTVAMVHAMFSQPVSYIDRCSMIASFPQAGLFMSSWWIENYAEVGRPIMREILANAQPVFVIANSPLLIRALQGERAPGNGAQLMYEDQAALQSNYVHQWGPIWIAGKALPVTANAREEEFLISGDYRLESRDPVVIDGVPHSPGMRLAIGRGVHRFASPSGPQFITLRWVEAGRPPSATSPYELGFGRF
jgi:hypothetical protein